MYLILWDASFSNISNKVDPSRFVVFASTFYSESRSEAQLLWCKKVSLQTPHLVWWIQAVFDVKSMNIWDTIEQTYKKSFLIKAKRNDIHIYKFSKD